MKIPSPISEFESFAENPRCSKCGSVFDPQVDLEEIHPDLRVCVDCIYELADAMHLRIECAENLLDRARRLKEARGTLLREEIKAWLAGFDKLDPPTGGWQRRRRLRSA